MRPTRVQLLAENSIFQHEKVHNSVNTRETWTKSTPPGSFSTMMILLSICFLLLTVTDLGRKVCQLKYNVQLHGDNISTFQRKIDQLERKVQCLADQLDSKRLIETRQIDKERFKFLLRAVSSQPSIVWQE